VISRSRARFLSSSPLPALSRKPKIYGADRVQTDRHPSSKPSRSFHVDPKMLHPAPSNYYERGMAQRKRKNRTREYKKLAFALKKEQFGVRKGKTNHNTWKGQFRAEVIFKHRFLQRRSRRSRFIACCTIFFRHSLKQLQCAQGNAQIRVINKVKPCRGLTTPILRAFWQFKCLRHPCKIATLFPDHVPERSRLTQEYKLLSFDVQNRNVMHYFEM